ncbi:DUF6431 domain-containing protein [Paenibacillus sp. MSJ-34]|uniref:DUF6431 domain-containing protein n=1 Tax=Paenibacillus sp. MSJ-34 TaxID=2841529 RepID=UPI00119FFBA1|nr:DUF6431 domain-containing protein [Paenibacillus sp. MSJ-34]
MRRSPAFFVRCAEVVPSPCCSESLSVIGSRSRKLVHATGEKSELVIRRLRCIGCRKIHHELPDCIVPYKRYESACVENVITLEPSEVDVAADHSTLFRWRSWFCSLAAYLLGCLESIAIRFHLEVVEESSAPSQTAHHSRFGRYVGDAYGWLSRVVRPIANSNLWVHTRSAFLSEAP